MTDKNALPDFSNKCLSVSLIDDEDAHDLVAPKFEWQAGRLFLIGVVPNCSTKSDWTAGCTAAVAWDRVQEYVVFDSEDAFLKAAAISESSKDDGES